MDHRSAIICSTISTAVAIIMSQWPVSPRALAAAYLIGRFYTWRGNDVSVFLWIAAGVGILIMAGSLLTAFSKLRCPYCGASLMAGGRMPSSLPHFCPDCGKTLDDCD